MKSISTRKAYGEALASLASHPEVVVLDADLSSCTMTCGFARANSDHFFNCGIAEANMVGVAAGLATAGHIPFVNSFAMFMAGRCFDQIRNSVAYPGLNVKLVGTHAGLSVGEDGATHQCLEDIGAMRTIPGMTILCPCDGHETRLALRAAVEHRGPVYLRLGRKPVETVTESVVDYTFQLGKGAQLAPGGDVTIIATGAMVQVALAASRSLADEGIGGRVVDMHTVKPLDEEMVEKAARETGAVVTAEEHNLMGGLADAVSQILLAHCPVPFACVGVPDCFGHSGTPEELFEHFGLTPQRLAEQCKAVLHQKK